jgi:Chaperone of endosialidase
MGDIFGGNSGGTTYNMPAPAAPAPIDYEALYGAARKYGKLMLSDQSEELQKLYPKMTAMQLGTARQVAGELDNQYLARTRGVMDQELQAASAPSAIEAEIQRQAQEELMLGRSLSPEQERAAQQSARGAFAARGLGTSAGSSAAEILNRDAMSQQRLDQRRQFALGANQLDLARRGRRITLAEGYGGLDPFARGLNPAFGLGQATMGQGTALIGNTFNNAVNQAGNVESFNRNMQAGMFNSWQNNNAAIQAANITGRASTNAGMMSMFGGLAQGAGAYFSDERMKKDIKQTGKDGVLGLKTYEYRYKGEDKDAPKRTGFMAQDVAKVLPEAVEEVNYRGKKRLAIKPMVIGQTLAAALASQQDAMFADGYTVGKGFKG